MSTAELRAMAREIDEYEVCSTAGSVRRRWLTNQLVKLIIEGDVPDTTNSIGMGPINLDVDMARSHGWSEDQIKDAWAILRYVSLAEGERAERKRGMAFDPKDPQASVHTVQELVQLVTGDRETAELVGEAMQPWVESVEPGGTLRG